MTLPKIIASCAVRASNHGDTHGGVYVVDLQTKKYEMVVKWNQEIDFHGRGAERGLRGIVKTKDQYIIAASSNILFFDKDFNLLRSVTNPYLKYVHEICLDNQNVLWITSTGYDALIRFSLDKDKFVESYQLNKNGSAVKFDPNLENQITHRDTFHLNSISFFQGSVYFGGVQMNRVCTLNDKLHLKTYAEVPPGTHNAQPLRPGRVIMNNTPNHQIQIMNTAKKMIRKGSVRRVPKGQLINGDVGEKIATQPFARGLVWNDDVVVTGSSPAMITVYDFATLNPIKEIVMSNDIRYTIHGISWM